MNQKLQLYQCPYCNKEFDNRWSMINHRTRCNQNPNKYSWNTRSNSQTEENIICPNCGTKFSSDISMKQHLKACIKISPEIIESIRTDYHINGFGFNSIIKKFSNVGTGLIRIYIGTFRNVSHASILSRKTHPEKFKHSDETKNKIRKARINFLKKKSGKTAWERKANGELSYLEEWFLNNVINEYELYKKYDIINEYFISPYFIDFAFTNINVAVELDGKCHFDKGSKRLEHDIKKDEYLNSLGWTVFRIKYDEINEDIIKEFMNFISNIKALDKVMENRIYKNRELIENREDKKKQLKAQRKHERELFFKQRIIDKISLINNSNIDFSKLGWVVKTSNLLNCSHTEVIRFMKTYMPDFYKNCYKRRTNSN
jgi:very-short-patch-repair endonuclease